MSWTEHRDKSNYKLEEAIIKYLGLEDEGAPKTWEEHEEIVDTREDDSYKPATLLEKTTLMVENTVDNINDGRLIVESGEELLAVVKSVAIVEQLNGNR